jgi:hypothetical protein
MKLLVSRSLPVIVMAGLMVGASLVPVLFSK